MSRKVLACLVAVVVAALAAVLGVILASPSSADEVTVTRVIDGSAIEVRVGDGTRLVRLLDIDVPTPGTTAEEAKKPCLADEATAFVESLVDSSDVVTLDPDATGADGQGPDRAHVRLSDGRLMSAELVRAGLAVPTGPDAVGTTAKEAAEAGRGFFDPALSCTPAAQVAGVAEALRKAEKVDPGSSVKDAKAAAAAMSEIVKSQAGVADDLRDSTSVGVRAYEDAGLESDLDTARARLKRIASMQRSLDGTVEERRAAAGAAAPTAQQSSGEARDTVSPRKMTPERPRSRQEDLASLLNSQ